MTLKYARRVFARLACLLAAATPLAGVSPAAGDALIDGDSLVQNEISLTTVPGQAGTLVMAYNDDPYPGATAGLGIASRQGAAGKWATTQIPHPTAVPPLPAPPAVTTWVFDPTITADSAGNVYAGFIGAGSTQTWSFDSGLYVARSPTGSYGQAWNPPVQVSYDAAPGAATDPSYRFNDRCQITSDTVSTGSGAGNVYISWIKDRGFNVGFQSDIYFATSTDQGATWTYPTPHPVTTENIINDNPGTDMANIPIPTVAADGTVYVAWLNYNVTAGGTGTVYVDKSTDGGATWGTDTQVAVINLPPLSVHTAVPTATDALAKGGTPIAADPTNSNNLYVVYAEDVDRTDADEADIYLIKSTDGGVTWTGVVKVNHDDTTTGDNILPWIDVKCDGTIDVAWYDRRNDPNDVNWDVYMAKSSDGGASFSPNVMVNDTCFATPTNLWMGEYLGLAVDTGTAYVAWTSSLTDVGDGDVYFDEIPNASIPEPVALSLLAAGACIPALRRRRKAPR